MVNQEKLQLLFYLTTLFKFHYSIYLSIKLISLDLRELKCIGIANYHFDAKNILMIRYLLFELMYINSRRTNLVSLNFITNWASEVWRGITQPSIVFLVFPVFRKINKLDCLDHDNKRCIKPLGYLHTKPLKGPYYKGAVQKSRDTFLNH